MLWRNRCESKQTGIVIPSPKAGTTADIKAAQRLAFLSACPCLLLLLRGLLLLLLPQMIFYKLANISVQSAREPGPLLGKPALRPGTRLGEAPR